MKITELAQAGIALLILILLTPLAWCQEHTELFSSLPYSEGGPGTADPGADLAPQFRRYVDAERGSDNNDGTSPQNPWKSLRKVAEEKASLAPGTHILFRRGSTWRGNLDLSDVHGSEGNRIVLGAFGELSSRRPKVEGSIILNKGSYLMLRDFECIKIDASSGAHHVVIFDNVVHGSPELDEWPSNGIRVFGVSHHISIVQNLVYDLRANDCIVIHPDGRKVGVRDSFWIVDNICIGNSRMEDGIDLAMSEPEHDTDSVIGTDVKVVRNRIQMKALAGLSARTGRGSKCFNAGHEGKYIWVVGNVMGGSQHIGMKIGADKEYVQVSGNVMFNCANNNAKVTYEPHCKELWTEHNTFIHTMENRAPVKISGINHSFTHNLMIRAHPEGNWAEVLPDFTITEMDYNWYGHSQSSKIAGKSWEDWQESSGSDVHSRTGDVPGISAPEENPFNDDPHNWRDPAFFKHFIPNTDWAGDRGVDTPGAFDSDGNWLGLVIKPLPGLENQGYGWAGPPLVRLKLKELGVEFGGGRKP